MKSIPQPKEGDLAPLFRFLLGEELKVEAAEEKIGPEQPGVYCARYVNQEGKLGVVGVSELPLVAYAGSALSMIPKNVSEECISDGTLPEGMLENFREVMNVGVRALMQSDSPHLRLLDLVAGSDLPAADREFVEGTQRTTNFNISVPGYGSGNMTLFLASD